MYYASYFSNGNGLVESTNKNLLNILKKTIATHNRNWHSALHNALQADIVTPKYSIGNSPLFLFYGTVKAQNDTSLPVNTFP